MASISALPPLGSVMVPWQLPLSSTAKSTVVSAPSDLPTPFMRKAVAAFVVSMDFLAMASAVSPAKGSAALSSPWEQPVTPATTATQTVAAAQSFRLALMRVLPHSVLHSFSSPRLETGAQRVTRETGRGMHGR
ncbi:hypothetical protein STANM309S_02493 [Streptomyces tanashiensis]